MIKKPIIPINALQSITDQNNFILVAIASFCRSFTKIEDSFLFSVFIIAHISDKTGLSSKVSVGSEDNHENTALLKQQKELKN
ncbi:MAG: hypothetical protein PHQ54_00905 [Candidatus Omnitrophica bacterium]|nr:hypothetical protein [Candidatus Omnitrophota bacterium]